MIQENIFNNLPIRRITIAMNDNSQVGGVIDHTPFWYRQFGLEKIEISRNGIPIIQLDTSDNNEPYYTTLKAFKWTHGGPDISRVDYPNHYILAFDLTVMQDANNLIVQPELTGAALRLKLEFKNASASVIEVHVIGEMLNTLRIDGERRVSKDSDG